MAGDTESAMRLLEFRIESMTKLMEQQGDTIDDLKSKTQLHRVSNDALIETIKKLQITVDALKAEEKAKLRWGIGVLGSVVMALFGILWAYRGVIFKGSP